MVTILKLLEQTMLLLSFFLVFQWGTAFQPSFYEAKLNINQAHEINNVEFHLQGHPKSPPPPKSPKKGLRGQFKMSINHLGFSSYEWSLDLTQFHLPTDINHGGCTLDYIKTNGLKCETRKYGYYFHLFFVFITKFCRSYS